MLRFYKKKRDLQQYICDLGFFSVFVDFVGSLPTEVNEEMREDFDGEEDELLDSL